MDLKQFCGKEVTIITVDGQLLCGVVDDYFFPEDNENGKESIVVKTIRSKCIEVSSDDIEKITVDEKQ